MSYPYSVKEIDTGMIVEGIDEILNSGDAFAIEEYKLKAELSKEQYHTNKKQSDNFGYWLDNCGDGIWYCQHCLQPECGKREAECLRGVLK